MKKLFSFLIVFMALSGCMLGSKPSNFFMLSAMEKSDAKSISNAAKNISIDVRVPGYIDRPQIVTKTVDDAEYDMSEFNRWLEPLSPSMGRVVAENISYYLPKSKVKPASMGVINPDYKVIIDVDRFDGKFDAKAHLRVWWSIVNSKNDVVFFDNITLEKPLGATYNDLVNVQSELLQELSLVIAKRL